MKEVIRTMTKAAVVALAALSLTIPGIIRAETEPNAFDDSDLSLGELLNIVVFSVSEFDETLLEVPSSVSVIEEKDWLRFGARRPNEAIAHLPGVAVLPYMGSTELVKIRGYANSTPRGMATLLDGVSLNTYGFNTASYHITQTGLAGLKRIELIRGPGSVQYGTDAFHGVLSLRSYASDEPETRIFSEVGTNSYGTIGIRNTSLIGDHTVNLSIQAGGQGDQSVEYRYTDADTNLSEQGNWPRETEYYTGSLIWRSSQDKDWFYDAGLYWKKENSDDYQGYGRLIDSQYGRTVTLSKDRDFYSVNNNFYMGRLNVGGHLKYGIDMNLEFFHWRTDFVHNRWLNHGTQGALSKDESQSGAKLTLKQQENAWNTRWSLAFEYNLAKIIDAGDKFFDENGNQLSERTETYSGFERRVKSISLQARSDFLDDRLHLHYGARLDHYNSFGTQVSPRLGVVYKTSESSALKLLYGRAFRAASAAEQGGTSNIAKGFTDIEPETIDSYEAGYLWENENWSTELIYFQTKWRNGIAVVPSSDPNFRVEYANQQENDAEGFEFSLKYTKDRWLFDYSGSYITSQNEGSGADYVAFPRLIQNVGLGYEIPAYRTGIRLLNRIESDVHESPSSTSRELSTFWQTDLHISYQQTDRLGWRLSLRNLFDRDNEIPAVTYTENGFPGEEFNASLMMNVTF